MAHDPYLKFILTVIALELLWLGAAHSALPVRAQAQPAATHVVITGIDIEGLAGNYLPVGVAGSYRVVPPRAAATLGPLTTRVEGPVSTTIARGTIVKVEADRPLPVQQVDYTPRPRPGE
jgi:hypothetical protein